MDRSTKPNRTCPKCGSGDDTFRSRKKIEAVPDQGEPEQIETKYRCKSCGEEGRVRVPASRAVGRRPIMGRVAARRCGVLEVGGGGLTAKWRSSGMTGASWQRKGQRM